VADPCMEAWTLRAPGLNGETVPMRDWSRDEVDVCVIGAGAAGGVVGAKLAEAGLSVVILEAGPHWSPVQDFTSDETDGRKLYWLDERITAGADPLQLGENNSGRGVGGGTVHYSMIKMRLLPHDFLRRTMHGAVPGADIQDWPLTYADLEPYYDEVEAALQVAGPSHYPWGPRRRRYPQREHRLNATAEILVRGCSKLGITSAPAPVSTLSAPHGRRPPCVYRGFCNYGCSTNAKSSVLVTYIPRAIAAGAEVRAGAMAARIEHDAAGRATGVLHFRGGKPQLQRARLVIVAGYAIETPRLLLNSQSARFPDGLANTSGMVGRCLMVHTGEQVFARYDQRINQYKAPPGLALTEDFNRELPGADFIGGYTIECVGPHVGHYAAQMAPARGLWGPRLRSAMLDYNHFAAFGLVGDVLPQRTNRVGLHATEVDGYGLPLPYIWFSHHENDHRLVRHATAEMERIHAAAGGVDIWAGERTAHLMGGCRMGANPEDAVVDRDGRAFDVPNLFICDGSVFPSAGAGNPSLTIQAVAARTADRIVAMARRGELRTGVARVAA